VAPAAQVNFRDEVGKLPLHVAAQVLYEKIIRSNLPGDEVYYTNSLIFTVKITLCSKPESIERSSLVIQGPLRESPCQTQLTDPGTFVPEVD
jgi:hypothetical protein